MKVGGVGSNVFVGYFFLHVEVLEVEEEEVEEGDDLRCRPPKVAEPSFALLPLRESAFAHSPESHSLVGVGEVFFGPGVG